MRRIYHAIPMTMAEPPRLYPPLSRPFFDEPPFRFFKATHEGFRGCAWQLLLHFLTERTSKTCDYFTFGNVLILSRSEVDVLFNTNSGSPNPPAPVDRRAGACWFVLMGVVVFQIFRPAIALENVIFLSYPCNLKALLESPLPPILQPFKCLK